LTSRVAKYEMQMVAEREIGRVDSVRMPGRGGSDLSAAGILNQQRNLHIGVKSSASAMSPGLVIPNQYNDFNIGDYNNEFENQELNEEIKKLLMEN